MKKLVLMAAVVCSVSLFSCGGADSKAEAADSAAADSVEVTEVVEISDSVAADSVAAPADSAAVAE